MDMKTFTAKIQNYSTIITFCTMLLGSVGGLALWVDTRYAHAEEVRSVQQQLKDYHAETQAQIKAGQQQTQDNINFLRKKSIDDKLFEYEYKINARTATPLEKAQHERLQRERREIK
jgi:hypothetical protein